MLLTGMDTWTDDLEGSSPSQIRVPDTASTLAAGLDSPRWFQRKSTWVWVGSMVYVTGLADAVAAASTETRAKESAST
ncbi:hypothetical protein D3C72_1759260 [compost metagenome]